MPTSLSEITQQQLTTFEKESILKHAVDLHLVGSDEADDAGFDLIEARAEGIEQLYRISTDGVDAGIMYVIPFRQLADHHEMTILVHGEHRGKHITSDAVDQLESRMKSLHPNSLTLCATVREHNPMRKELTAFLTRHGYQYDPGHMAFMKTLK